MAVGRYLAETVAAVPHFTRDDFDKMLGDQSNDCTLVRGGACGSWRQAGGGGGACGVGMPGMHAMFVGQAWHWHCALTWCAPSLAPPMPHPQVLFLSKLIQAHLALADKLGTMQLPLI